MAAVSSPAPTGASDASSRYVLVIYAGGWPRNAPPKVVRIVSCDTDAEYFTIHAPNLLKDEKALLVERAECGIPPSPTLEKCGGLVYRLQKRVEADLTAGRL